MHVFIFVDFDTFIHFGKHFVAVVATPYFFLTLYNNSSCSLHCVEVTLLTEIEMVQNRLS